MNFKIQQTYPSPTEGLNPNNTLIYIPSQNSLLLYGGRKIVQQQASEQPKKKIGFKVKTNNQQTPEILSIYSFQSKQWSVQQTKGKVPIPRTNYKTITIDKFVILYGGKSAAKLYNEVYALNTENWTWKKLFVLDGPPPSQNFLFTKVNNFSACLIVNGILWILSFKDVNWDLGSNQLPGTVCEKIPIQLPQNPLFCFDLGVDQILVGGVKKSMIISTLTKQCMCELQNDFSQLKGQVQATLVDKNKIFASTDKKVQLYCILKQKIQKVQEYEIGFNKKIKCMCVEQYSPIVYMITEPENSLVSIDGYDFIENEEEDSQFNTMREINKSPTKSNSCIMQEENESSIFQSHQNQVMGSSSKKLIRNQSQIHIEQSQSSAGGNERIKNKLTNVLTHETFKRKLLETKVQMLEDIIKKSQKFVLKLCKYGNNRQKKLHIERVKQIRQNLQSNWKKEMFYRNEMVIQKVPAQLKKIIDQPLYSSQTISFYE